MLKQSLSYKILLSGTFLWCAALLLPPAAAYLEYPASSISHLLYGTFSTICHQFDSRSIHLFGYKLGVCARCTAIYFGFLAGVLLCPVILRRQIANIIAVLIAAALPMLIDVGLDAFGLHTSTLTSRLATGSVFGILVALVLTPTFQEALNEIFFKKHIEQGVHYESKT